MTLWAVQLRSENRLDGYREHLCREDRIPVLFSTRGEARSYINSKFGYIRTRPDLRREPHGWKMPRPVRARVEAI